MLIVETIAKIRRMRFSEDKGIKTIARELKISKNTVRKVIRDNVTSFKYERKSQPYRVLSKHIGELSENLAFDLGEPSRRRRTAKKHYEELLETGYDGSYEAVNNFVKKWSLEQKSLLATAYVPLAFEAGDAFQFDWSEEEIKLDGKLTRIKVAHIKLSHSRYSLLVAYPNEQMEMVMDAHDRAFQFFGGVCQRGIYDNMKTAVYKVLIGKERDYNKRFKQMASHHLFEPVACTPASGWEKGQVEKQVQDRRRQFFTPLCQVKSLDDLNTQLESLCVNKAKNTKHPELKEKTVWEVYQLEKPFLQNYRGKFDGCKIEPTTVNSTCMVNFETNSYSVECCYVRKDVEIRAYTNKICVYYKNKLIASHERSFARHKKIYNPWHYVPLLERKPGALRNGAPFKDWELPKGIETFRRIVSKYDDGDKAFIKVLLQIQQQGLERVDAACMALAQSGVSQPQAVLLELFCSERKAVQKPERYQQLLHLPINRSCSVYNALYQVNHSEVNYA